MLLDPELAAILPFIPPQDFSDLDICRKLSGEVKRPFDRAAADHLRFETFHTPRADGSSLELLVVSLRELKPSTPVLLHYHGGGFAIGDPSFDDDENAELVSRTGAIVVSPAYRLAPEHPYPAPFDDCCLALQWAASEDFPYRNVRTSMAVMGHSAGGGLAAGAALWSRDEGGIPLAAQFLLEPEVDARLSTPSMISMTDTPIWYRSNAILSWEFYLGGQTPTQYASPALAKSLAGLPKTYVTVNQVDPLRDEGVDYAKRLVEAGVPTELHMWPGAYHGFMAVQSAEITHRATAQLTEAINGYLAPRVPVDPSGW